MLWYSRLYVGERAKKHRFSIIQGIRGERCRPGIYVITPASNGNNILDIYPAMILKNPYYKKKELLVLGIADGYQEALELAGTIVQEMYQKTGGFCLKDFLKESSGKV